MTQPGGPIDVTYVELRASGERDAVRDIDRAADDIERRIEKLSKDMSRDIDRSFNESTKSVVKHLNKLDDGVRDASARQRAEITKVTKTLGDSFEEGVDAAAAAVGRLSRSVDGELEKVRRRGKDTGESLGKQLGEALDGPGLFADLARIGTQLKGISALLPSPLVAALVAAVPAIIALGGALLDLSALLLALPAAISVVIAAFATLKVAFGGVNDAISALATGDLKKIEEAMRNLSPSARLFAREVDKLRKPFLELRKVVQESFFGPLRGDLTALANATLPTLRTGMSAVAAAFAGMFKQIGELLGSNDIVEALGDVFESTARIITNISPQLTKFLGTLFGVIEHGLPFIERAFAALGRGLESLSGFLSGSLKTGDFEDFLETAFSLMKDLGALTASVGKLLVALFGNAGDEGQNLIRSLTQMVDKMTEFLNSAEGQEALQRLLDSLPVLIQSLQAGLIIFGALIVLQEQTFQMFELIGRGVVVAAQAVGGFFAMLWGWIQTAGSATGGFFASVGNFFATIGGKIAAGAAAMFSFFGQVVESVRTLPGRLLAALKALPGVVADIFNRTFDQATYIVGFAIGSIIKFALELPGRIKTAISTMITFVSQVFTQTKDAAIRLVVSMIEGTLAFLRALPGRVRAAIAAIIGFIGGVFTSAKNAALGQIVGMVNTTLAYLKALPGRAKTAVSALPGLVLGVLRSVVSGAYNIGLDILRGVANGISAGIGWVYDMARRAASNILQGMKDALGIGSPSKVFADEVGRQITAGIGVGVRAEIPDLRRLVDSLGGRLVPGSASTTDRSINFGRGAVQIDMHGDPPDRANAERLGGTVGTAIARTLARRDVRTAVRTA